MLQFLLLRVETCGEFNIQENLRQAKKRETTMTSMRAEVAVCVKKSEGKLVNVFDYCTQKETKWPKLFRILLLRSWTCFSCCAPQHLPRFTSLLLKKFLFSGALVNSNIQLVHSANDLQTILIGIVGSAELPFLFLNCSKSTFRNLLHHVRVILSRYAQNNNICTQQLRSTHRAKLCDGWISRKKGHVSFQHHHIFFLRTG